MKKHDTIKNYDNESKTIIIVMSPTICCSSFHLEVLEIALKRVIKDNAYAICNTTMPYERGSSRYIVSEPESYGGAHV